MRICTVLVGLSLAFSLTGVNAQSWKNCIPGSMGPGGCESMGPGGGRSMGPGGGQSMGPGVDFKRSWQTILVKYKFKIVIVTSD